MDTAGVSKHVEYEIRKLIETHNALVRDEVSEELHDPVLESFAVHTRNLIEFFYDRVKWPTDARAEHFFSDPAKWKKLAGEKPPDFEEAKAKVDKQISHLTYDRVGLTQEEKGWLVQDLALRLFKLSRDFVMNAEEDRMGEKLLALKKAWQEPAEGTEGETWSRRTT